MSLEFTDQQIKKITNDILGLPLVIDKLEASLVAFQAVTLSLLATDQQNEIFYLNFKNIVERYHAELIPLNGLIKENYDNQDLLDGSTRDATSKHFPTIIDFPENWYKFQPKLIDSNNGNPTSNNPVYELTRIATILEWIDFLLSGFTDGALEDVLTEPYVSGNPITVLTGGFLPGQRIVIDQANQSLLAEIVSVGGTSGSCSNPIYTDQATCELNMEVWTPASGAESIVLNVLSNPAVILGVGARVRNFHPGFTNAERENTSIPYAPEVRDYAGEQIESELTALDLLIQAEKDSLDLNDATGAEETQNTTAKNDVIDLLTYIDNWLIAPDFGLGIGRLGDSVIDPLEIRLMDRQIYNPVRVSEVTASLGSVSQLPDGSFSGSGNYETLFKWIDLRINQAAGSLTSYLSAGIAEDAITQQITQANTQLAEYEDVWLVKTLTQSGDGSEFLDLTDVVGLSISDEVKIMDNDSIVITRTIVNILVNTIELNSPVVALINKDLFGRVAKRV